MLLLLLDIVWIGFTYFASRERNEAPYKWAIISTGMLIFLIGIYGIDGVNYPQIYTLIFAVAMIRSFLDYGLNYSYYFP